MTVPANPKIYHIVHVDRLPSIIASNSLLCDAVIAEQDDAGTTIGMPQIKQRRLVKPLQSHPNLVVGQCVPFYFCPRSVMLYLFHMNNHPELTYHGGQSPIVHLQADLHEVVNWAEQNNHRWAFTLSNAGSGYFEDRADLERLGELDWQAIQARDWRNHKEGKQAEFLVEESFPWELVSGIGVKSQEMYNKVSRILSNAENETSVEIKRNWYY